MMWRLPRHKTDRKWTYNSVAMARKEAGLQTMEEYIQQRKNTVTQYIYTRSLLDLCERTERAPGAQVGMWWWEQAGINLAGAMKAKRWKMIGDNSDRGDVKEDSRDRATKTSKSSKFK